MAVRSVSFALVAHFAGVSSGFQAWRHNANITEGELEHDQVCLGSVCGRSKPGPQLLHPRKRETYSTTRYELRGRYPFCTADRSSSSRVVLLPYVAQHHGATALASVLVSGSEVSTLCKAETWQCDGDGIAERKNTNLSGKHKWLERYSGYWNLNKQVLLAPHPDIEREMSIFVDELLNGPPRSMRKVGIDRVFLLNVIMWRPVCMGVLNGSIYNETSEYARHELKIMEDQVAYHKQLVQESRPVLVISFADLLWSPVWARGKIHKMIPCIGKMDFDRIPELHYDHYPKNEVRVDTSVLRFGESNPASQCDYDIKTRSCGSTYNAFLRLTPEEQARAQEATSYLDKCSQ